ncbi:MAG: hypothetical protein JST93_06875 [Acidobacteria bacterium]|nr:hypothetical protein [Acidobacteriota bacterium]
MGPAHIGMAVLFTVAAILVVSLDAWAWGTTGKPPRLDSLFLPTMALISWRRVQVQRGWSETERRGFAAARLAYRVLLAAAFTVGLFDWHQSGRVALPGFAALYLVLEIFPQSLRWLRPIKRAV